MTNATLLAENTDLDLDNSILDALVRKHQACAEQCRLWTERARKIEGILVALGGAPATPPRPPLRDLISGPEADRWLVAEDRIVSVNDPKGILGFTSPEPPERREDGTGERPHRIRLDEGSRASTGSRSHTGELERHYRSHGYRSIARTLGVGTVETDGVGVWLSAEARDVIATLSNPSRSIPPPTPHAEPAKAVEHYEGCQIMKVERGPGCEKRPVYSVLVRGKFLRTRVGKRRWWRSAKAAELALAKHHRRHPPRAK